MTRRGPRRPRGRRWPSAASSRCARSTSRVDARRDPRDRRPNGAGKTTMFDVITGVYRPARGPVWLDGGRRHAAGAPHRRTRAGLARSFQTVGLAPGLTARDNVLATIEAIEHAKAPFAPPRAPPPPPRQRPTSCSTFFGLDDVADTQVTDLPLGTTKLLELAKVFAGSPKVVLLDEPFAGLTTTEARAAGRADRAAPRGVRCRRGHRRARRAAPARRLRHADRARRRPRRRFWPTRTTVMARRERARGVHGRGRRGGG